MNTVVIILILMILYFIAYLLFNKDFFAPACVFCMVFIIACINLFLNTEYWAVNMHFLTVVVICLGVVSFIAGSCLAVKICSHQKSLTTDLKYIYVNNYILFFWILLEIFIAFLAASYLLKVTSTSLFKAITIFRQASFTNEPIEFPMLLSNLYFVCRRSGYLWAYIGVNNYFAEKRINPRIIVCYGISALYPLLVGERGSIIELLIGTMLLVLFFYQFKSGHKRKYKFGYILLFIVLAAIGLYLFTVIGTFIGREVLGTGETISIYLGAPILNLDSWLMKGIESERIWDNSTLLSVLDLVRPFFSNSTKTGLTGMGFRVANGHLVGNVYTTFCNFYYDHGIYGVIFFSMLMGYMIQYLYTACKRGRGSNHMKYILLSFLYPLVCFSFFSNRFFVAFDDIFIKSLVVWGLLIFFIIKAKVVVRRS